MDRTKWSFQALMEENKNEMMQDQKMIHNIIDRIEDKIHATLKEKRIPEK